MTKLAEYDAAKVIDVLNERLAFERAGVKLYDRVLEVVRPSRDENVQRMPEELQKHRDEEWEHEEWLEGQIRSLGGDAHSETERSRLVTRESKGIEEVVMSDAALPHLLHALLAAELVDNAGWDLLVQVPQVVARYFPPGGPLLLPRSRNVFASTVPKILMSGATSPVQPVWCEAPTPAPLSPWKYS
jgi:hypothetical protein